MLVPLFTLVLHGVRLVSDEQPWNILSMVVTFVVLSALKFKLMSDEQP